MTRNGEVQFKGTKGGLLVRLEGMEDFDNIKERLAERLDAAHKFFHGSAVTVDVGNRALTTRQLLELEALFSAKYGVRVLQVVNGGLDIPAESEGDGEEQGVHSSPAVSGNGSASAGRNGMPLDEFVAGNACLVKRTIRSGQRISYNGNVVILGDVNPGAEVIAGGDVVVMGSLRGVVHAGATGDDNAVIVAFRLKPTQLRIGSHISRAPDDEPVGGPQLPEIARVKDGEVIIDFFSGLSLTRSEESSAVK